MSEEEIKDIIKDFLELREIHSTDGLRKSYLSIYKEAIQGLLDLYNKEKEKNEELKMKLLEKDFHIDGLKEDRRIAIEEIQEQYFISKDKIKEKIEEIKRNDYSSYDASICLQELLDEGE